MSGSSDRLFSYLMASQISSASTTTVSDRETAAMQAAEATWGRPTNENPTRSACSDKPQGIGLDG